MEDVKARKKRDALMFLTDFKEAMKPKPRHVLSSEFIKEYNEIEGPNLRESTLLGIYGRSFKSFINVCGDRDLSSYTTRDVDLFKARRVTNCSPTTVNIEFRSLKRAFNCGVRWDVIKENPFMKSSPLRVPEKRPTCLTEEEFSALLQKTGETMLKRLFEFAVLTGMRLGEIQNLRWSNVDFEKRLIDVSNCDGFLTKTGKIRVVPMSNRVVELLKEMRADGIELTYAFEFNRSKVSRSYIDHKFREYRKAAGLQDDVTFHSLRHTFATWLVQRGVSIFEVQKLLGHSDIKVTQVYSHLAASELHGAVNRIRIGSSDETELVRPS